MHKNLIFLAIISIFSLVVLYFSSTAFYNIYLFKTQSSQANAFDLNWSIVKLSEDRYAVEAEYAFIANNHSRSGKTVFKRMIYRNAWAAKQALASYAKKPWIVWYSKGHSTLEKVFPLKESIYCAVMWILLIYFLWLGFYVGNYERGLSKKRH